MLENYNNNLARKCIRYHRNDIRVYICHSRKRNIHVELHDISQQGMSFRCHFPLKLNKHIMFKIIFDCEHGFRQKGKVVRKVKIHDDNPESSEKKKHWLWFEVDNSLHDYGVRFDKASPEFKTFLLQTNIKKRIANNINRLR